MNILFIGACLVSVPIAMINTWVTGHLFALELQGSMKAMKFMLLFCIALQFVTIFMNIFAIIDEIKYQWSFNNMEKEEREKRKRI